MSQEEGSTGGGSVELVGLPVGEAVEAVLGADGSRDPEAVRTALETVSADGVVHRGAVREALAEAAKVVSTPETRVELAAIELAEARETAETEGVTDLGSVRTRIDEYEVRLDAVEERIAALGPELRDLVNRRGEPGGAYEVATGVRTLRSEANELQYVADELQQDVEAFGRWLADPEIRYDEFESEVTGVEGSVADLAETVDAVEAATDETGTGDVEPASDPKRAWADATVRTAVVALLVTDLRGELADLRAWPTGERGADTERVEGLAAELDGLDDRRRDLRARLGGLARPSWTERFGEHVAAVETELGAFESPVPWGEVEATLARHRELLEG